MAAYFVQIIETAAAFAALKKDWHALESKSHNSIPFRTFEWLDSWWRHFPEHRFAVADHLLTHIVRDAEGSPVLAAPMMITERPSKGPVRIRILQFFGTDPNITELRGPLCDPDHESEAHRTLREHVSSNDQNVDWIEWSGVVPGSAAESELTRAADVIWNDDVQTYIVPLARDWDTFRAGLKRNVRQSLRKCYNSLKSDGLSFEFECVSDPADLAPALDHFFVLHRLRAEMSDTVQHPDVFASITGRDFLREVTTRLAERGIARVFLLRINGRVVAARIGFVLEDTLYLYCSGFLPSWGRYSVATTLLAESLKWAMEQGLQHANLSTGHDASKTRWGPTEVCYRHAIQFARGSRSQAAWNAWQAVQRASGREGFQKVFRPARRNNSRAGEFGNARPAPSAKHPDNS